MDNGGKIGQGGKQGQVELAQVNFCVYQCHVAELVDSPGVTGSRTDLTYLADRQSDRADATVTTERAVLNRLVLRETSLAEAVQRGLAVIDGSPDVVAELVGLLDDFTLVFEVVEPKRGA